MLREPQFYDGNTAMLIKITITYIAMLAVITNFKIIWWYNISVVVLVLGQGMKSMIIFKTAQHFLKIKILIGQPNFLQK